MQLNITGHNVEITEALREFVTTKFAKLEQYFERINQVYVVLKVEKVTHISMRRYTLTAAKFTPARKAKICMPPLTA